MKILSTTETFLTIGEQTGAWFTVPDDTKRFYDLTFILDNVNNESAGWLDFDLTVFSGEQSGVVFGIHAPDHIAFNIGAGLFGLVLPPNNLNAIVQSVRVRANIVTLGPNGQGVKVALLGGVETI